MNSTLFSSVLKALEAKVAQDGQILTEARVIALERKKQQQENKGEIEIHHPGYQVFKQKSTAFMHWIMSKFFLDRNISELMPGMQGTEQ